MVLSRWLATPFAARGRLVAWIEQHGKRQKVVVRDMSTGRLRLVSMPPRCSGVSPSIGPFPIDLVIVKFVLGPVALDVSFLSLVGVLVAYLIARSLF